ncbi:hypothetical protein O181_107575 [Austropuccinia psidii MF-1]|uniref:Uncharacterized protein n=1 Tax=Austropuccinia psidii MF-1 TaxID=1389203 RepID=A0A9Q3PNS2_9BASI|nr:hypothetical protein [Austropuccinia psidii MF-1]
MSYETRFAGLGPVTLGELTTFVVNICLLNPINAIERAVDSTTASVEAARQKLVDEENQARRSIAFAEELENQALEEKGEESNDYKLRRKARKQIASQLNYAVIQRQRFNEKHPPSKDANSETQSES